MKEEKSAGGIVLLEEKALILRRFSGDWVLPKGHIEEGETPEIAAMREVREETGISGEIHQYIGHVYYVYTKTNGVRISKTVHFYSMRYLCGRLYAQREEGFARAEFIPFQRALRFLAHRGERDMLKAAIRFYRQ